MNISAVILSAGRGTRMKSSLPKALHPVGGKPLLARVLKAACQSGVSKNVWVLVKQAQHLVEPIVQKFKAESVVQGDKPGTAGALMSLSLDKMEEYILVINGDHPLIEAEDLRNFCSQALKEASDIAVGTCFISDPKNFGRVIREGEKVSKIVESYDFTEEISDINEVNTGLMLIRTSVLKNNLHLITDDNPKKEYPLTDLISLCFEQGLNTKAVELPLHTSCGVNTQEELSLASSFIFEKKSKELMDQGVIFPAPHQVYIEEDVEVGSGSIIYPGVYLKGRTKIGSFCAIEQNCFIFDSVISNSVHIKSSCYLEKAQVHSKSVIGPFAHLREGSLVSEECKVGNFVEMKKTVLGAKSKASHTSYLGDSVIGKEVNIGWGACTCNYAVDKKKYKTSIKDKSFIGSGSLFIAPVEVGEKAVIGAGSVITENVPPETLALARARQEIKKKN